VLAGDQYRPIRLLLKFYVKRPTGFDLDTFNITTTHLFTGMNGFLLQTLFGAFRAFSKSAIEVSDAARNEVFEHLRPALELGCAVDSPDSHGAYDR